MLSKSEKNDALALILDGKSFTNDEILTRIRDTLSGEALRQSICADVYTYRGRTLVIAYPAPPLRERVDKASIRLIRK